MSGLLLHFEPSEPSAGQNARRWIEQMDRAFDQLEYEGRPPRVILMGPRFYHDFRCHLGRRALEARDVSWRGVPVESDQYCPGVWMGDDPRESLLKLEPYDPERISRSSEDRKEGRIAVRLIPIKPANAAETTYRVRVGPHVHVQRGETYEEAVLRQMAELERAVERLRREILKLARPALQNRSTKVIAKRLLALIGIEET